MQKQQTTSTTQDTPRGRHPKSPLALALCGGGIMGGAYELGCLAAYEDFYGPGSIQRNCRLFIGTSAGANLGAMLAAGISPKRLYTEMLSKEDTLGIRRQDFVYFQWKTVLGAGWRFFQLLLRWLILRKMRWSDFLFHLPTCLPSGVFSLDKLEQFYVRLFEHEKIPLTFGTLGAPLVILSTDLDTSERIVFSVERSPYLSIPKAICASSAIPLFYKPPYINGRYCVDGGVLGVAHMDIAIERGFRKILVINPLVPIENDRRTVEIPSITQRRASLFDRGMGAIFTQVFRGFVSAALDNSVEHLKQQYPDIDITLIQPDRKDAVMFLWDSMDFSVRAQVAEFGYQQAMAVFERLEAEEQEKIRLAKEQQAKK